MQNYTEYVGTKSTFRLLNRGSAKALDKIAELYGMNTFHVLQFLFIFSDITNLELNLMCWRIYGFKTTDKGKEVLIVKTTIHDIMNKMIRVRNIFLLVY